MVLSGLPVHQNGMYGLRHKYQHFESFDGVRSLLVLLSKHNIRTGLLDRNNSFPVFRSVVLSGLPVHQNGMYGLHGGFMHFQSFNGIQSLPALLKKHNIRTGLCLCMLCASVCMLLQFYSFFVTAFYVLL